MIVRRKRVLLDEGRHRQRLLAPSREAQQEIHPRLLLARLPLDDLGLHMAQILPDQTHARDAAIKLRAEPRKGHCDLRAGGLPAAPLGQDEPAKRCEAGDLDVENRILRRRRRQQRRPLGHIDKDTRQWNLQRRGAAAEAAEEIGQRVVTVGPEFLEHRLDHPKRPGQIGGALGGLDRLQEFDDRRMIRRGRDQQPPRGSGRRDQTDEITGPKRPDQLDRLGDRLGELGCELASDLDPRSRGQPVVDDKQHHPQPAGRQHACGVEDGSGQRRPEHKQDQAPNRQQKQLLQLNPPAVLPKRLDQETHRRPLDRPPPVPAQQMDEDGHADGGGAGNEQSDGDEAHPALLLLICAFRRASR